MQELEAGREAGAQAHSRNKAGGRGVGHQDTKTGLPLCLYLRFPLHRG